MNLDEELRATLASESQRREPPFVDAKEILARGKARQRRRTTLQAGVAAAAVAVIGIGAFGFTRADRTSTMPAMPPRPVTTTALAPIAPTLENWDCVERRCLKAGTYRVWLGSGDDGNALSAELRVPWPDWSSYGYVHRVWKESGDGSVMLNVYEPVAIAGSQPCDSTSAPVDHLPPDATVYDVVGRLRDLPQFTGVEVPTLVPAYGQETIHLRIQADSLRCEAGDQYNLADINGGDGVGTTEGWGGDSDVDLGRKVVIDFWVFDLDGQNIVVEARHEGRPSAAMIKQLYQVRQSVRFVSGE